MPREQVEILFNQTTDIHLLETQGRINPNETVTQFLLQYLNDKELINHIISIDEAGFTNMEYINKVFFDPPIRTNYIRLTPISFENSIAMRFEIYSKGVLYLDNEEDDKRK